MLHLLRCQQLTGEDISWEETDCAKGVCTSAAPLTYCAWPPMRDGVFESEDIVGR